MRILLTGHGCAPNSGSEPGMTWNWAVNLARNNDVWFITHAHFRPEIERHMVREPIPRLHFTYTGRLGWWDPLRLPSLRGIRFHYVFWLRRVLQLARELDALHDFDVVHHLGWSTVSAPPLLGRLGKPFVWGPVGGGQTTPTALLGCYGRALPAELLRTLRVRLLPFSPAVRRVASGAAAVFSVNHETTRLLRRAGAANVRLLADVGIPRQFLEQPPPPRPLDGPFTVLWAGRMEARKGIGLCLEVARLATTPGIHFVIAGDGPLAAAARRQAGRLGIAERVSFLGRRPWREVQALMRSAHAFLFTSLRDTFGMAAVEALAGGAPMICIDHQGVGAHVPAAAAVKIPVVGLRRTAAAMARAIHALASDRARLAEMSQAARRYAETEAWDRRAVAMQAQYEELVEDWHRRRRGCAPRTTGWHCPRLG